MVPSIYMLTVGIMTIIYYNDVWIYGGQHLYGFLSYGFILNKSIIGILFLINASAIACIFVSFSAALCSRQCKPCFAWEMALQKSDPDLSLGMTPLNQREKDIDSSMDESTRILQGIILQDAVELLSRLRSAEA